MYFRSRLQGIPRRRTLYPVIELFLLLKLNFEQLHYALFIPTVKFFSIWAESFSIAFLNYFVKSILNLNLEDLPVSPGIDPGYIHLPQSEK
jgi:hypothetical protein